MFGLRNLCHTRSLKAIRFQFRTRTPRCQSSAAVSANSLSPVLLERARSISAEHAQLSKDLANEYDSTVARKLGELSSTAKALECWESAQNSLSELEQLLRDPTTDQELRTLATEEVNNTSQSLGQLASQLRASLVPAHPFTDLPCLLEIRPGVGGSEAALFVADLMRMYQAFCKRHRLRCSTLKLDETPGKKPSDVGVQEVVLEIEYVGAYNMLRSEGGIHRVQRVPATETAGRIHTSVASVLILPRFPSDDAEDVGANSFDDPSSDYFVDPKDVRTEFMRSSGAGGQHVNTTDSAVRLTHIPTNTIVAMQDQRSQHKNRAKAWQILRGKIADARREAREEEKAKLRLSLLGGRKSAGRSDKIRTYSWGQQRVTDHRSGITLNSLDDILEGGESLDKLMESVKVWFRDRDVEALIADEEVMTAKHASKSK